MEKEMTAAGSPGASGSLSVTQRILERGVLFTQQSGLSETCSDPRIDNYWSPVQALINSLSFVYILPSFHSKFKKESQEKTWEDLHQMQSMNPD